MPSWPRAWTTGSAAMSLSEVCRWELYVPRPWVYCTDMMFAHVEMATIAATICITSQPTSHHPHHSHH